MQDRCSLTRQPGKFVKCHIIPEALTETVWQGQPLMQKGKHGRPIKRWTSWYDPRLVTKEGETILQSYDDWAIKFFRDHKLIWSSWGPMQILTSNFHTYDEKIKLGWRTIDNIDHKMLRLFYLSILWRSAATSLWEFKHITIEQNALEQLRTMVLNGDPEPYHFFPIGLIQLSTRTTPFNQALSKSSKREPTIKNGEPDFINTKKIDFFRIYFDGLVAQLDINVEAMNFDKKENYITRSGRLFVLTMPIERSAYVQELEAYRLAYLREKAGLHGP